MLYFAVRRRFSARTLFGLCMNTLDKIEVDITVELGATTMPIHHLLRMGRGAVIELDTTENDPLRVYANNRLVALARSRSKMASSRSKSPRRSSKRS